MIDLPDDYPVIDDGKPYGPECVECGEQNSAVVSGKVIYPHRPDLYKKNFWLCPCGAYCGCHRGTANPLGRPCGPRTRAARGRFHSTFDAIWRDKKKGRRKARSRAYERLAAGLGVPEHEAHGAMMDAETCNRAIEIIKSWSSQT